MPGNDINTNRIVTNSIPQASSKPASSPARAEQPSEEGGVEARASFQPRKPQPQTQSKARSGRGSDKPRPTPQEARQTYFKWLERLEARAQQDQETKALLDSTRELTTRLSEPNLLAVYRFIEIFGLPLVKGMVEKALTLHKDAAEQGPDAHKLRENPRATRPEQRLVGTEVATAKGEPRTPGGIFFFLMRGHVTRIRLAWEDLRVPWLPDEPALAQAQNTPLDGASVPDVDETSGESGTQGQSNPVLIQPENGKVESRDILKAGAKSESVAGSSNNSSNLNGASINLPATTGGISSSSKASGGVGGPALGEQAVKPTRGKVVITGRPKRGSQLKVAPQGLAGVLELLFEIEPGANPPKGLPVLEKTLVKVWCTEKQYNKIKESLNPTSRYLIEGEIGAGINSQNFEPFIRVIATRLTTIELEQAAKASQ